MSGFGGVDGGGTRSRAIVVDDLGRELGGAVGAAGRVDPASPGRAADAVESVVAAAADAAGVGLPLRVLWCGLAGAGRESARTAVLDALSERGLARRLRVGTDVEVALRDAFDPGEAGILLLSGTGSIALGRGEDGRTARVGGWGPRFGDEGSGYRIGLAAIGAVLRAHDGRGATTALRATVLDAFDVADPEALVPAAGAAAPAEIARLAPDVVRASEQGDEAAHRIVTEAVTELIGHASAARARLEPWDDAPRVALAGGLASPGRPLRERVAAALRREGFRVARRRVRGERGAARLALDAG